MLIHVILILCLQLMKFGEGKEANNETAFYDRSWNWKNACEKHPLAIDAKAVENKNDLSIGKRCTLKFDYAVDEGDEARAEFCRAMFPDQLRSSNMEGSDKIACVYQRTYACSGNNKEFLIGSKCLKIAGIAMNLADAKIVCEFRDFKLFSPADVYSFEQPVPTVWTFANQVAAQYYLKYSAIGSRPGDTVLKTDAELGEEAMAVCVRKANAVKEQGLLLPGSMNIDFDFKSIDINQTSTEKSKEILSGKEQIASRFLYVTSRYVKKQIKGKDEKDTIPQFKGVPVDQYWPNLIKEGELKVNPGILYWNKKGQMENVEQFRRAPIMCGSGKVFIWKSVKKQVSEANLFPLQKWPFYWLWFEDGIEEKEIGKEDPNYKGWSSGQPDYARRCPNPDSLFGLGWTPTTGEGKCYREKCVALSFYNGKSTGLNDIVCEEHCVSATIKSVACVKWAKPVVNSDE